MTDERERPSSGLSVVVTTAALVFAGCSDGGTASHGPASGAGAVAGAASAGTGGAVGMAGASGAATGGVMSGGSGGASGSAGTGPGTPCTGTELVAPKRVVRLSFNQQINALASLFGAEFANATAIQYAIPDAYHRTFPPLSSTREGASITDSVWQISDNIANAAGQYVFDHFPSVTACPVPATDECARAYLTSFAQRAHRRPLTTAQSESLIAVFDTVRGAGGTAEEGVRYGVYAVLSAPEYLYRTELGADAFVEGPLSLYEKADQLAFFITDAPPDAELLAAAADGSLANAETAAAHVSRILATDAAKRNLEAAVFSFFTLAGIETVIVDSPDFTGGIRNAMFTESERFLADHLWSGSLDNLLLSRKAWVNAPLAALYGVPFPIPGAEPDVFASVDLPAERSGMLTQLGFLVSRARPDVGSVVARGLQVNQMLLCIQNPGFPEDEELVDEIEAINDALNMAMASERERVEFRASSGKCNGCHSAFDAYGLALENFDVIGRYRGVDELNRPIDASVILPEAAGGRAVANSAEMAAAIAESGAFARCMAKSFLGFGLAQVTDLGTESCATQAVVDRIKSSDGSFTSLIREVALSNTLSQRTRGVP